MCKKKKRKSGKLRTWFVNILFCALKHLDNDKIPISHCRNWTIVQKFEPFQQQNKVSSIDLVGS